MAGGFFAILIVGFCGFWGSGGNFQEGWYITSARTDLALVWGQWLGRCKKVKTAHAKTLRRRGAEKRAVEVVAFPGELCVLCEFA